MHLIQLLILALCQSNKYDKIFKISCLVISLLAACISETTKSVYDLVNYDKITPDKDSVEQMQVVYVFKGDKRRHLIRTYYNDGSLLGISYFYDKKKDGRCVQYLNSKLTFEGSFLNGKKVGLHKYYFPNGTLFIEETYSEDTLVSKTEYNEKGEILYTDKRRSK